LAKNCIFYVNNYRPISLLNVLSKLFEKAIKTRLLSYSEENNLLPNSQFGFSKGLGTENALANLIVMKYITTWTNIIKPLVYFLDL